MKKVLVILLLALFTFAACNDDSSILEPSYDSTVQSLEKGRIILNAGTGDNALTSPSDSTNTDSGLDTTSNDKNNKRGGK